MTILFHPLLMAVAVICLIAGISAAMFFRTNKNWLKMHKTLNSSGLFLLGCGIIYVVIYIASSGDHHLSGVHQIIGLIAFVFTCVSLFLGFRLFTAKNKPAMRTAHRLLGRLAFLLTLSALILGLILTGIISL